MMASAHPAQAGGGVRAHLSFAHLVKQFPDGVRALDDVSFDVPRGQFCVVLGRSGSGKTTLLRTVNGLTALDAGTVALDGAALTKDSLRATRRKVAMVHQQFNLVERASVAANVLAGAIAEAPAWRVHLGWHTAGHRARACAALHRVGLDELHLSRRASALSGGQQQRVGIARAILLSPEVILADEPVASLDPAISREILVLLRDVARETGATVLCSLHQTDLAREFADRIVGMRTGRVVFDGHPAAFDAAAEAALYDNASFPPFGARAGSQERLYA